MYEEALPILYHSVTFCPWDLQGIFPLFLETLSSFAKSHIRYVWMNSNWVSANTDYFYWALNCAQVAKLNGSLLQLELGDWHKYPSDRFKKHAILYPLLKIKAMKKHIGGRDKELQQDLADAALEMEARADARRVLIAADTAERRRLADLEQISKDRSAKKPKLQNLSVQNVRNSRSCLMTDEREVACEMAVMPHLKQCVRDELVEWDMVSVASAASSPSLHTSSIDNGDARAGMASSIIDKDDISHNEESDGWELVDKPLLRSEAS